MRVIDSHTEGEPTRLVITGGPDLGNGPITERCKIFATSFDHFRTATISEPRGFDAMVGALLCDPVDSSSVAGLIFFNNAGYLGMCGHGAIGAAISLHHLGRIGFGPHRFETPVGTVTVDLIDARTARIENVESFRLAEHVDFEVPGYGFVKGEIAWGGNWFFLTPDAPCALKVENIETLTRAAKAIKQTLSAKSITGSEGAPIDHIEFSEMQNGGIARARNFILCPGGAYDRSPCGTGTSAKLACLAASGNLKPGEEWIQQSIIGSKFSASYRPGSSPNRIIPSIIGRAFVCSEATLIRNGHDPFADGIPSIN